MSQPCSAVELVLFDARGLVSQKIRDDVDKVVELGVLTGAVADDERIAQVVEAAGLSDRFGFWFGGSGNWPFERALAFANVEPGRTLFVSDDPVACREASAAGVRLHDERTGEIATLLP